MFWHVHVSVKSLLQSVLWKYQPPLIFSHASLEFLLPKTLIPTAWIPWQTLIYFLITINLFVLFFRILYECSHAACIIFLSSFSQHNYFVVYLLICVSILIILLLNSISPYRYYIILIYSGSFVLLSGWAYRLGLYQFSIDICFHVFCVKLRAKNPHCMVGIC